ncbi:unnamed protein product, partial [Aureobasidium vineae]
HNNIDTTYDVDDYDEDVPLEIIEDVLEGSANGERKYFYWLADSDYPTVPKQICGPVDGTRAPSPRTWQSPFVGSTIEAAFEHVKNAPGKLLNKSHIVVLDKPLYEDKKYGSQREIFPTKLKDYNIDEWDEDCLVYALFCFEDVLLEVIKQVLEHSAEEVYGYCYWLADDCSTLPQSLAEGATKPPLPRIWHSPFVDSTIESAFQHIKDAPGDFLNRKHVVVLDPKLFKERKLLRVYRKERLEPEGFDEDPGMDSGPQPGDITGGGGRTYTTVGQLMGSWAYKVDNWKREGLPSF